MPPEAELPPEVVEGPRSRFEMPTSRVCTRVPEPAGAVVAGRAAAFFAGRALEVVDLRGAAAFAVAFFFVPFALAFGADFLLVDFPAAFFAELFFVDLLAAFDFLPEARAAILDFPSRSWWFDVRARA